MKTVLIIALICLLVGAILVGVGLLFLTPDDAVNSVKDSVYRYTLDETPTQIHISTLNSRVELRPIEGDEWRVECMDQEKLYHTVELNDGVLTIKQIDTRAWYDHISIFNGFQNLSVIVHLPAEVYESLHVQSLSGGIRIQEGLTFTNAALQNTSGSINCASFVTGALNAKNTSGSIYINGRVGGDLKVQHVSGSVHVIGGVGGAMNVTGVSGRIEIANATPTRAVVENTSGGIYLENVVCQESCTVTNVSGSIELAGCDAMSFDLKTTSGGIRASLLSAKTFDCHTTSGSVHVPKDGNGGTFRAKTVSGSIRVTVAE